MPIIGVFRNSLVGRYLGLLHISQATTLAASTTATSEMTKKDRKNAKFISDTLFGDNLRTSDGVLNNRYLFKPTTGTVDKTLEALQPLIHANYKKNDRVRDDLQVHTYEIDLSKNKEELRSEFYSWLKVNNISPHIFILKLRNGSQDSLEKLKHMLHIIGDREATSNISKTFFITNENQLFEDIKVEQNFLHAVSTPKWYF